MVLATWMAPVGCFGSDTWRWVQFLRCLSLYLNSWQVWDLIERTFKNFSRNWGRNNQSWSSRSWVLHQKDGIWSLTNVITPLGSQFVVGRNCGNTLVGFLNPFPEHVFLLMFLPTVPRSVLARRLVGGSRQWVCCIKWAEKRSIQMSSASMQQSVLVRKAVNCRELWAYWNRCMKHILDPMCSATVLLSVHVKRAADGSRPWVCLRQCPVLKSVQMNLAMPQQSVPVRSVVNGNGGWACWRLCWKPKSIETWLATLLPSVPARKVVNGSRQWVYSKTCMKQWYVRMSYVTAQLSVHVRRVVSGSKHWVCLRRCAVPKFIQTSLPMLLQSAHVRRMANGSLHWACLRQCVRQKVRYAAVLATINSRMVMINATYSDSSPRKTQLKDPRFHLHFRGAALIVMTNYGNTISWARSTRDSTRIHSWWVMLVHQLLGFARLCARNALKTSGKWGKLFSMYMYYMWYNKVWYRSISHRQLWWRAALAYKRICEMDFNGFEYVHRSIYFPLFTACRKYVVIYNIIS